MALTFSSRFTSRSAAHVSVMLLMLACGFPRLRAAEEADDPAHSAPPGITKAAELKARQGFDKADTNGDQVLDEAEYLARLKPEHQKIGRLEFLLSDDDQDQQMSFQEYFSTPAVPLEQRRFPDPVRDRVQELLRTLKPKFVKWDSNADDQLSKEEFQKSQLADHVPGLENTFFPNWDQDEDGQITHEEIERLLEIAYAVRTPEGELLREPNGRVVNWMLFRHLDSDHDNQLSAKELKPRLKDDKKIADLLKQADQDKDQQLSLKEWKTTSGCWIDPVYYFRRIDKNFDARLNPEELASDSGFHRDLAPYLIPAFDRNADGVLTLREYLNTPISNPVVKWHVGRKDENNNGTLSESEFDWNLGLSGRSLIRDYFHFLDQDQNRQLDQREFLFTTRAQTPRKRFDKADTNEDGVLEQAEYLATLKPEHQKVGRLEFRLSDQDQDQKMSFQEYFSTPAVPLGQRRIPDPVRDRVQQQLDSLKESYRQWDDDSDQELSILMLQQRQNSAGNSTSARSNGIPGLELTPFRDWDRDGDGQISREDAQLLLEIAYAVRTPEGVLLREPTGRVVNWMLFRHLDLDHNGKLSANELLGRFKTEHQVEQLLKQADRDQDEQLDLIEWKTTDQCWIDPVYYFKRIDHNFDARLDPDELASDEGFHRELAPYLIPAFDENGDGVLSFSEYLNTPITNPIVKWHVERRDRDNDGVLTTYEFTWGTGLTGRCLIRDYFNKLDVDDNHRLDQREFIVKLDLARAPRDLAFKSLDQNEDGHLTVDEIFAATKAIVSFKNDIHYQKVRTKFEQEFKELDRDHDERLNLDEFQNKTTVVLLPPYSYSPRMINHFKRNVPTPENKLIPGVVGAFNILLVCAVVFYFVRLKFKR